MKNRRLLLFIFGLLVLIYFWGSKNKDGTTSPDKTVSNSKVKSLKLIEEKIRLEKEKSTASASPNPDASFTGINPKIKETQKSGFKTTTQFSVSA